MSFRIALFAFAALLVTGASQPPEALPAIAKLQPGQWALTVRDDPAESRSICIADPHALLQIEHSRASCSRFVIANSLREATVHYTCPGRGHGRTTVRTETPRLAQIETQGIVSGAPFSMVFEARRTGDCAAVTGLLSR
jgi:hypothetical protein